MSYYDKCQPLNDLERRNIYQLPNKDERFQNVVNKRMWDVLIERDERSAGGLRRWSSKSKKQISEICHSLGYRHSHGGDLPLLPYVPSTYT